MPLNGWELTSIQAEILLNCHLFGGRLLDRKQSFAGRPKTATDFAAHIHHNDCILLKILLIKLGKCGLWDFNRLAVSFGPD